MNNNYAKAVEAVHDDLMDHPTYRLAWKWKPDQGPEDVGERDTEKAMYAGEPKRYKNYSYRLLCYFVNQQQPGATPLTCSEAVFEDALQKTNERCHSLFRGLPASAHYQGPQCFRNETALPNSSSIRVKYRLALGSERAIATGASWSCSAVTSAVRNGAVWIPPPTTYL